MLQAGTMNHPPLAIYGYSEAAMFLRRRDPKPNIGALISIHGSREFGVEADVARRLDLSFDDIETIREGADVMELHRVTSRRRWAAQQGLIETPPTPDDVAAIIRFALDVRDVDGIVLCHCGAGISRAPAAALVCLAAWRGPGTENDCVHELFSIRRAAVPHAGLVRLADDVLQREGRLVAALRAARP
jgi:predicted protein tyrosine phosphatase